MSTSSGPGTEGGGSAPPPTPPPPSEGGDGEAAEEPEEEHDEFAEDEEEFDEEAVDSEPWTVWSYIYAAGWILVACGVAGAIYVAAEELFPSSVSPNAVFNRATEELKSRDDVKRLLGEPLKAYGMDHGGRTEGRRNLVDSAKYQAEDGSTRQRIQFTLEGPHSRARVWAEASSALPANGFVYLIAKDMRSGRFVVAVDRRAELAAAAAAKSRQGSGGMGGLAGVGGSL